MSLYSNKFADISFFYYFQSGNGFAHEIDKIIYLYWYFLLVWNEAIFLTFSSISRHNLMISFYSAANCTVLWQLSLAKYLYCINDLLIKDKSKDKIRIYFFSTKWVNRKQDIHITLEWKLFIFLFQFVQEQLF